MTLTPTFARRFHAALALKTAGHLEEALEALAAVFDPLEDPDERRVASAEFCIRVELEKVAVLTALGRTPEALELLEDDWMWRLVNQVDEQARRAFFQAYGEARSQVGAPWKVEKDAILQKLESVAFGPHRLRGWDAFLRQYPS